MDDQETLNQKETLNDQQTVAVTTRGRGRPKGTGGTERKDMQVHTKPGDNSKFLSNALTVSKLPPIDTSDARQVEQRINEYFEICIKDDLKPTVSGCALALGVDRRTFNSWCNGKYRSDSHQVTVKKAHDILDTMMENYMMNGKINPVAGIFLMKNNHHYTDQQEVVLTPKNPLGEETDEATLQQRYIDSLPAAVDDSDATL